MKACEQRPTYQVLSASPPERLTDHLLQTLIGVRLSLQSKSFVPDAAWLALIDDAIEMAMADCGAACSSTD